MPSPYLFMLALPRSGSTLLAYVLDSHSRIHVEHEDSGQPYPDIPNKELPNLRHKIERGFKAYLDGLLEPHRKDFLVTSRYFARSHVEAIAGALGPEARFIVLTRRHMWRTFHDADGGPHSVAWAQLWQFAVGRRWAELRYPHITVAYEDLVKRPAEAFARICDFIGVDFEPDMLDYSRFPHPHLEQRGNSKTRRFARIVDTVARDAAEGEPLVRHAAERLGLQKPTRGKKIE